MIETVGDLLKLLHKWPSSKRLKISHRGESTQLSPVTRTEGDELVIETIHRHEDQQQSQRQAGGNSEIDDALDQCDRILEMCDAVPERGEDFAESIRAKVESICSWIEQNGYATDAQRTALDNMERGVARWVERD